MDNYSLKLINDACNYYEQNQPTPVKWKDYRVDGINVFVFDLELYKIIELISSSEKVIRVIFRKRRFMYQIYSIYTKYILYKLNRHKIMHDSIQRTHFRVIKQCIKIAIQCYRNVVHEFNSTVEKLLNSDDQANEFNNILNNLEKSLGDVVNRFQENIKKMMFRYYVIPGCYFGILDGVIADINSPTHYISRSLQHIIPMTDISVFEFLIMDLYLIHLPILNHEELMVENNRELEHLIRGRCKKLKEIYDTHLIFNEKYPNFPEDCTNHILKYCQENYVLSR